MNPMICPHYLGGRHARLECAVVNRRQKKTLLDVAETLEGIQGEIAEMHQHGPLTQEEARQIEEICAAVVRANELLDVILGVS